MRACVGKGADTRQAAIDQTSHRGADEQEGKGKDDAEGSHVTLSGYRHRLSAVVGALITMRRFRSSAPKAKNGFVARRIVSLPTSRRNNVRESQTISGRCSTRPLIRRARRSSRGAGRRARSRGRLFNLFRANKPPGGPMHMNGNFAQAASIRRALQLFQAVARSVPFNGETIRGQRQHRCWH